MGVIILCDKLNLEIFVHENFSNKNLHVINFCCLTHVRNYLYNEIFNKEGVSTCEFDLFDYMQKNVNISLSKREVGHHLKQTRSDRCILE